MLVAVVDLLHDDRAVRGGNKAVWAVIIVFVNLVGPILYFLVGRDDTPLDDEPGPGRDARLGQPSRPADRGPDPGDGHRGARAEPCRDRSRSRCRPPGSSLRRRPHALVGRAAGRTAARSASRGSTRRYPGGVLALDGLTMEVPTGSVFGLLGPNGAGKTTTLRLLAGLTTPTAGTATVNGTVVAADALAVRRSLGYLEQDPRAYAWMTGREQLLMLGRLHGLVEPALGTAVRDALARVDLLDAADRHTSPTRGACASGSASPGRSCIARRSSCSTSR